MELMHLNILKEIIQKKRIKGKRNNRNQDDRGKKMATTPFMLYESKWEKNKSANTLQ